MEKDQCIVEEFRGDTGGSYSQINPYKSPLFDVQIKDVFEKRGSSPYTWLELSHMPPSNLSPIMRT